MVLPVTLLRGCVGGQAVGCDARSHRGATQCSVLLSTHLFPPVPLKGSLKSNIHRMSKVKSYPKVEIPVHIIFKKCTWLRLRGKKRSHRNRDAMWYGILGSSEKGLQEAQFLRKRKQTLFPGGQWYKSKQNENHTIFLGGEIASWCTCIWDTLIKKEYLKITLGNKLQGMTGPQQMPKSYSLFMPPLFPPFYL